MLTLRTATTSGLFGLVVALHSSLGLAEEPAGVALGGTPDAVLYVQVPKQIAPNTVAAIAEVGQKSKILLSAGASIADEILRICGAIDPSYAALLAQANNMRVEQIFAPVPGESDVVFPACAKSPSFDAIDVSRGDSIEKLLVESGLPASRRTSQRLAAAASQVFNVGELATSALAAAGSDLASSQWRAQMTEYYVATNAQQISALNGLTNPDQIQAGTTIDLPAVKPLWSAIRLADGKSPQNAQKLIEEAWIKDGLGPNAASGKTAYEITSNGPGLVEPLAVSDSEAFCGPPEPSNNNYPFDIARLIEMLAYVGISERDESTIMTLDTGVDITDVPLRIVPERNRAKLKKLISNNLAVPNQLGQLVDGYNLSLNENSPASAKGYKERWHGLSVYGAALGSSQLQSLQYLARIPVRVAPVSLLKPVETGFLIDVSTFQRAVDKAVKDERIGTLNISFFTTDDLQMLKSAIGDSGKSIVLTVAAGNDGLSFDNSKSWPAIYGGNPANANGGVVVTVGAHDQQGHITGFSRKGWKYVDILAPGCNVPTYKMNIVTAANGTETRSISTEYGTGTSFSAPLVAFASALLQAEGLSGNAVKARLITSADVSSGLDNSVYSRGKLNLVKALPVSNDLVETNGDGGANLRIGIVRNLGAPIVVCGQEYLLRDVAKLAIDRSAEKQVHLWIKNQDLTAPEAMERVPLCALKPGDNLKINFQPHDSEQIELFQLSDVSDFISAN